MKFPHISSTLCTCFFINKALARFVDCVPPETSYQLASKNTLWKHGLQDARDERLLSKRGLLKDNAFAYDVDYTVKAHNREKDLNGDTRVINNLNQTQVRDANLREAKDLLKIFSKKLKSFIFKGTFDVINFEYETEELKEKLARIKNLTEISGADEQHLRQLGFVTHMFQVMSSSVAELKLYLISEIPGHALVYRIIEMNVLLLALHDMSGNLDRSVRWYEAKLFQFWRNLLVWGRSVAFLSGMPQEYRNVYDRENTQAMKTISELGGQFSTVEVVGF